MDEELKMQYQSAIYNLRNILNETKNVKSDIKDIIVNMEENILIDKRIINETELSIIEKTLEENIKRITNTIYSLSNKIQ